MRPEVGARIIERANLPNPEKGILLRALRNRIAVISHEELDRLNAAIDALPAVERDRVNQAMQATIIMSASEADLNL